MDKLIAQFPKQIKDALELASTYSTFSFLQKKQFNHVVLCGMGGSGIGGKMVAQLYAQQSQIPIVAISDYSIPSFVNEKTLFIACSYSGNTEETLRATEQAIENKATIVGVSSGGKLIKKCKENGFDFVKVPGGNPPRSMLAFSFIQLVNILSKAEIVQQDALSVFQNCRQLLNDELMEIKSIAKQLADIAFEKHVVFYADTILETVAIRARQQVNENSKQLCWHHIIPEMNHNELVGWGGGTNDYAVVFLVSQFLMDRNQVRFEFTEKTVKEKTNHVLSIPGKGKTLWEEIFYFIHIIDWASVFLAKKNNCDPVEVRIIDQLKTTLNNA